MTLFYHELKRNKVSLIVWSSVLSFMLGVCIFIYPEMSSQMNELSDMFANMGAFSDAFGMDSLNFGEFMGYFGIECGNTLGLGGAFFAALTGISAISKESRDKTSDFLYTHPISRKSVILQKLLATMAQIVILNVAVFAVCVLSTLAIGEKVTLDFCLILFTFIILQTEIALITFSISAFLKKGGMGIGLGIAVVFYFLNIISNLTDSLEILKYFTPFAYTDSAYITQNHSLDFKYIAMGMAFSLLLSAFSIYKFDKRDIQ